MKTLSKEIGRGGHDLNYKETLAIGKDKVRIKIRSDSTDFQSYATVELFGNSKWNLIDYIHHSQMKTPHKLYYMVDKKDIEKAEASFKADRDKLIKLVKDVLE